MNTLTTLHPQSISGGIAGQIENAAASPRSFRDYYLGILIHPRRTFDLLMADPRRLRFGAYAVCIPAFLYTVFYFLATYAGGAPSVFKPWLAIPTELYFAYDRFLLAPSMFLCWILAAGVVQLVGHRFSGKGSFEDTLSVLGFGISLATWSTLIHELADAVLGALGIISMKVYEVVLNTPTFWHYLYQVLMLVYLVAFLTFFSTGIGAAQRIGRKPAIFLGVVAFLAYQTIFLVFNR